ncbi:hypothetical protein ACJJTC_018285 [Scirpophaga incertulas]
MALRATSLEKICFKCKDIIKNKQFTVCSICNKHYHIECAKVSFARFKIWTVDNKKNWKCIKCIEKQSPNAKPHNNSDIPEQDNITVRPHRYNAIKNTSKNHILGTISNNASPSTNDSVALDVTSSQPLLRRSLSMDLFPICSSDSNVETLGDLSKSIEYVNDLDIVNDLKLKLNKIETDLQSCENELENTIIENNSLKRQIVKLSQEICVLKNICKTPQRPRKRHESSFILSTVDNSSKVFTESQQTLALEQTIVKLQQEVQAAQKEISELNFTIDKLEHDLQICSTSGKGDNQEKSDSKKYYDISKQLDKRRNNTPKNKICVISSNKNHKILQNINTIDIFNEFRLIHYLTNNVGIDIMIRDLNVKLKDYTEQDFCVIIIGEADFNYSQNFRALIKRMRENLVNIRNTNIIVTAPIYICGKPLYNYRVEVFNNILSRDMLSHNYGHLIDSNEDLTLDMFSLISGRVMRRGVRSILEKTANHISFLQIKNSAPPNYNVSITVDELDGQNKCETNKDKENNNLLKNQFFLV